MGDAAPSVSSGESEITDRASDRPTLPRLISRLSRKLTPEDASMQNLVKASVLICEIKGLLMQPDVPKPTKQDQLALVCLGIAIHRRHALAGEDSLDAEVISIYKTTSVLIFTLLSICDILLRQPGESPPSIEDAEVVISDAQAHSLWSLIRDPKDVQKPAPTSKRRRRVEGAASSSEASYDTGADADADVDDESVQDDSDESPDLLPVNVLIPTPGQVSLAAMALASALVRQDVLASLERCAALFYRSSSNEMAFQMLSCEKNVDFCTLAATSLAMMETKVRNEKLESIADAAESEAGQQVHRDLMLSFSVPLSELGVRRGLLISRATSTLCGIDHPELTQRSHEVAMAGTGWTWRNSKNQIERLTALLSGVAILTTKAKEDPLRKGIAFGGRLQVPFLETPSPSSRRALRLTLVPHTRRWVLYHLDSSGLPAVLYSQRGLEGACNGILQLVESLKSSNSSST